MEEEAPSRRSVAELAGRFKGSAAPRDAAARDTEKPVRRRPPRSLHIPKAAGDEQEPPGVTSPGPKAKRNSALIEKLQANLALSPTTKMPSPKSPGFKLLPPALTPQSPGSPPASTVTSTSPVAGSPVTEEEGPVSFENPLTVAEGSILSSVNKGRVRHSLRRRPPSRRHRKSSSGDEVGVAESPLTSQSESQDKGRTGEEREGEEEEGAEVCEEEVKTEVEDESSMCPEKNEEQTKSEATRDEEGENEEAASSAGKEEEEVKSGEEQNEDSTEQKTNTETNEEERDDESEFSSMKIQT